MGSKRAVRDPEFPFPRDWAPERRLREGDHLGLLANQNYVATTSNMTFSRALFERVGGFRPYRYVHDWDFALRSSVAAELRLVPHYLAAYRVHPRNTIAESPPAVVSEVREMFGALGRDHPELATREGFRRGLAGNRYLAGA